MDSVTGFGELSDLDRVELHMLYGACVADIELFTRQQWLAGAYALALYAMMLVGAYQFGGVAQSWLLTGLAWAVGLYGVAAVKRMQISISVGRRRLERVRSHFGRAFQEAWAMPKPREDIHRLLYGVMAIGAMLVTWIVLDRLYSTLPPA